MTFRNPFLSKRFRVFFFISMTIIVGVAAWLHYPIVQNAGSSNGYACSRDHIYIPRRLDFAGCKTVTGIIRNFKVEPDGDSHALLELDMQYKGLLTNQNYNQQQGYLVIEDTCHAKPRDILALLVCRGYKSTLPEPEVGKRYEITGNYVIDDWHGSWAEIHGVSELKPIK